MASGFKLSLSVIAPSFKIPPADLNACLTALKNLDVKLEVEKPLFSTKDLCSNTVYKRLKGLTKAFSNNSDYIWCLRGGYGALHLVKDLLEMPKPSRKIKLIGFSDITVLHYITNQRWNISSLHWKHLNSFLVKNEKGILSFNQSTFIQAVEDLRSINEFDLGVVKPLNSAAKKVKNIHSKVVGGNLITLQSLVGLEIPKPVGKILFLEEVDEPIYKIDRAFTQLHLNGWFSDLDAMVLGSFSHKDKVIQKKIEEYLKQKLSTYKCPVFAGLRAGHIPDQKPLFFNTESSIQLDKNKFKLKVRNGFI